MAPLRIDVILQALHELAPAWSPQGVTAAALSIHSGVHRQNVSSDLNRLCRDGLAVKQRGRPVRFWAAQSADRAVLSLVGVGPPSGPGPGRSAQSSSGGTGFERLVGHNGSLRGVKELATAVMLYPPRGLPALIVGPTGSGKSLLAEAMFRFAVGAGRLHAGAPFVVLNCADYAANPQLLLAQLFGFTRGAFTGAERDMAGVVTAADGGVLFLDEIHRLPPEGQEMLFLLMDQGFYRMLGEAGAVRHADLMLIGATSVAPESALLTTFLRRFPAVLTMPELDQRPLPERLALIERFLAEEAQRVGVSLSVSPLVLVALLLFQTPGNVGELRSAVLLGCARAFVQHAAHRATGRVMPVDLTHMSPHVQMAYLQGVDLRAAERLVGPADRLYHLRSAGAGDPLLLDVHAELRRRVASYLTCGHGEAQVQRLIQAEVATYVSRVASGPGGAPGLPALSDVLRAAEAELGCRFGADVVTAIHSYLPSGPVGAPDPLTEAAVRYPRIYETLVQLVPHVQQATGQKLTSGALNLMTVLLATGQSAGGRIGVRVVVAAHGTSTGSSMAAAANQIVHADAAVGVDVAPGQSLAEVTTEILSALRSHPGERGAVLLVDLPPLGAVGSAVAAALGQPLEVVSLVTTQAVIAACREALRPGADAACVAAAAQGVYDPATEPAQAADRLVVLTTCLTGEGTARKLAAFIAAALPPELRERVTVHPVDMNTRLVSESVIAATGTVDPHLSGVPFIGVEQLVFGDGLRQLGEIIAGSSPVAADPPAPERAEAIALAQEFVTQSITTVDAGRAFQDALAALHRLEEYREESFGPGQVARWVIHFAFALERLVDGQAIPVCSEMPYLQEHHGGLVDAVRRVVSPVVRDWEVTLPDTEIGFLALTILSDLHLQDRIH